MKYFHLTLRLLFGLAFIGLALKGILDIKSKEGFVSQVLDQFHMKILKNDMVKPLKEYKQEILYLENFFLLSAGLLVIFGFKWSSLTFGILGILIELVFVHNPYIFTEPRFRLISSAYLALLGGIIMI